MYIELNCVRPIYSTEWIEKHFLFRFDWCRSTCFRWRYA